MGYQRRWCSGWAGGAAVVTRSFVIFAASVIALGASLAQSHRADASAMQQVNDAVIAGEALPLTLAEFGFFRDEAGREPSAGVEPYRLNTALWSDGADKLRYIYLPMGTQMQPAREPGGLLQFPVGAAIIKTFAFGEGSDQHYIETRVLLHPADGWLALPYRWNAEQTQARLALAGARLPITTPAGEAISYRIPNKNQCKTCHSKDGEVVPIGPTARNLDPEWLEDLTVRGWLSEMPEDAGIMPVWGKAGDLEPLARAYLDVNCAHCHRPGGGASNSGLDLRWEQDDPHAIGIRKPPVAAGRGAGGHLVSIAPGDPDASILVYRMSSNEPGVVMPEIGRATVDEDALAVVRAWIEAMPKAKDDPS